MLVLKYLGKVSYTTGKTGCLWDGNWEARDKEEDIPEFQKFESHKPIEIKK